uniref:Uncharacterized protein n=1 Tax=Ixodes ricinus TaxID=34613 RepID=A0A6B0V3Y2_IXORI
MWLTTSWFFVQALPCPFSAVPSAYVGRTVLPASSSASHRLFPSYTLLATPLDSSGFVTSPSTASIKDCLQNYNFSGRGEANKNMWLTMSCFFVQALPCLFGAVPSAYVGRTVLPASSSASHRLFPSYTLLATPLDSSGFVTSPSTASIKDCLQNYNFSGPGEANKNMWLTMSWFFVQVMRRPSIARKERATSPPKWTDWTWTAQRWDKNQCSGSTNEHSSLTCFGLANNDSRRDGALI